jgi:hypothetical protein
MLGEFGCSAGASIPFVIIAVVLAGAGESCMRDGAGCSAGSSNCSYLGGVLVEFACVTELGALQVQAIAVVLAGCWWSLHA